MPLIKICGLKSPAPLEAALDAGADMVGFVFFGKSPRHVEPAMAQTLGRQVGGRAEKVALVVDADDAQIAAIIEALAPDWLQLHGAETPARVGEIQSAFGLPVMKAIGVAERGDPQRAEAFSGVAARILFDAKPPKGAALPGGNGLIFDWTILRDYGAGAGRDWMLSGGLNENNVGAAIRLTGAPAVDVSSGVETAPGEKSPEKIAAFITAARKAWTFCAKSL